MGDTPSRPIVPVGLKRWSTTRPPVPSVNISFVGMTGRGMGPTGLQGPANKTGVALSTAFVIPNGDNSGVGMGCLLLQGAKAKAGHRQNQTSHQRKTRPEWRSGRGKQG